MVGRFGCFPTLRFWAYLCVLKRLFPVFVRQLSIPVFLNYCPCSLLCKACGPGQKGIRAALPCGLVDPLRVREPPRSFWHCRFVRKKRYRLAGILQRERLLFQPAVGKPEQGITLLYVPPAAFNGGVGSLSRPFGPFGCGKRSQAASLLDSSTTSAPAFNLSR